MSTKHSKNDDYKFSKDSSATQFNLTVNGPQLDIYCCEPNEEVIAQYRRGAAKFALYENNGLVYFLSKFGDNGWMEAPFHAAMNPPHLTGVPFDYVEGIHHFGLSVTLQDISSDATYGARLVTLSKAMTARLVAVAKMQSAVPITRQDYESRIQGTFSRYTASQMARMAVVRCRGGEDEPAANEPMMREATGEYEPEQRAVVREFAHFTLLTGHQCIQRSEMVEPPAREFIRRLIEDALLTGWTELVLDGKKYPVHMTIEGSNLTCRLCLPCHALNKARTAVLIAVALDAVKGQSCWRAIHAAAGGLTTTNASQPPSQPWIAAMPMVDALVVDGVQGRAVLDMMQWVGDFEHCLAVGFAFWMVSK